MPQDKIRKISSSFPNNPLSPFYDPTGKPMQPVAKLELKKVKSRNSQCNSDQTSREKDNQQLYSISNDPDFDIKDLSNFMRRNQFMAIDSNTVSKKAKNKNKGTMRFVGK